MDPKVYRKRDELWWNGREFFRKSEPAFNPKIDRETLEQLRGELATPRYGYTPTGEIKVESKDDMKKRGVPSPNLADAFLLTLDMNPQKPAPVSEIDQLFARKRRPGGGTWMSD